MPVQACTTVRETLVGTSTRGISVSSQPRLLSSPKVTDDAGTTEGFVASVDEHLRSYVYVFVDPRNGQIFHADAATGDGCFRALAEARDQHPVVRAIEA